jgi:hypothetical protein
LFEPSGDGIVTDEELPHRPSAQDLHH